jgi:hypothetical protein
VQGLFDDMGLLLGWKAIAKYLRRSVSTVKRYQRRGLPVLWGPSGRPMAFKAELDLFHVRLTQLIEKKEESDVKRDELI